MERTVQFNHKRKSKASMFPPNTPKGEMYAAKGGITTALEVPTLEEFKNFRIKPFGDEAHLYVPDTITLEVGIAECSKKDNYNKKLGREIAKGRMKAVVFYARKENENEVFLVAATANLGKTFVLRKHLNTNKVYFEEVV